jgi:Domain of unknown function (DUF222)/HNH endonuclease
VFDVLDELETALDKAAASEGPLDAARLRRLVDRAEALWIGAVGDAERAGVWQADGYVSSAAWLRHTCRLSHGDAASAVKLSRTLAAMPAVADAFGAGEISRAHAQVVSYARTPERADVFDELDQTFADAARRLNPSDLRKVVQRVTDAIDGDHGRHRDRDHHARRRLHVSVGLDGMSYGDLVLEPEGREVLLTGINAVLASDHDTNDRRSYGQRCYDALIDLCRVGLAHLPDGPGRHNPPHLSAVFDAGDTTDPSVAARLRCDAAHGPISRATLERWACDSKISRIIIDSDGEILDVGRASRTHTDAQWRALVARDGGCVEPGCDRPPGWCDVHHIHRWEHGGETNRDNLELRCRRHHRKAHGQGP